MTWVEFWTRDLHDTRFYDCTQPLVCSARGLASVFDLDSARTVWAAEAADGGEWGGLGAFKARRAAAAERGLEFPATNEDVYAAMVEQCEVLREGFERMQQAGLTPEENLDLLIDEEVFLALDGHVLGMIASGEVNFMCIKTMASTAEGSSCGISVTNINIGTRTAPPTVEVPMYEGHDSGPLPLHLDRCNLRVIFCTPKSVGRLCDDLSGKWAGGGPLELAEAALMDKGCLPVLQVDDLNNTALMQFSVVSAPELQEAQVRALLPSLVPWRPVGDFEVQRQVFCRRKHASGTVFTNLNDGDASKVLLNRNLRVVCTGEPLEPPRTVPGVAAWTVQEVGAFLAGLHLELGDAARQFKNVMMREHVDGKALLEMSVETLDRYRITTYSGAKLIVNAIHAANMHVGVGALKYQDTQKLICNFSELDLLGGGDWTSFVRVDKIVPPTVDPHRVFFGISAPRTEVGDADEHLRLGKELATSMQMQYMYSGSSEKGLQGLTKAAGGRVPVLLGIANTSNADMVAITVTQHDGKDDEVGSVLSKQSFSTAMRTEDGHNYPELCAYVKPGPLVKINLRNFGKRKRVLFDSRTYTQDGYVHEVTVETGDEVEAPDVFTYGSGELETDGFKISFGPDKCACIGVAITNADNPMR